MTTKKHCKTNLVYGTDYT